MSIWRLLFLLEGRIGRQAFWLATVAMNALFAAVIFAASEIGWQVYPQGIQMTGWAAVPLAAPMLAFVVLVFWINSALGVKRLHDRGHHGAWWILFLLSMGGLTEFSVGKDENVTRVTLDYAHTLALLVFLIGLIEIGIRRGHEGSNADGAESLWPSAAPRP